VPGSGCGGEKVELGGFASQERWKWKKTSEQIAAREDELRLAAQPGGQERCFLRKLGRQCEDTGALKTECGGDQRLTLRSLLAKIGQVGPVASAS
jgi:hypothetical protein